MHAMEDVEDIIEKEYRFCEASDQFVKYSSQLLWLSSLGIIAIAFLYLLSRNSSLFQSSLTGIFLLLSLAFLFLSSVLALLQIAQAIKYTSYTTSAPGSFQNLKNRKRLFYVNAICFGAGIIFLIGYLIKLIYFLS